MCVSTERFGFRSHDFATPALPTRLFSRRSIKVNLFPNKTILGLLVVALNPLGVAAQQTTAGNISAAALPDAPSVSLAAAAYSGSVQASAPQTASPAQQTAPVPDASTSGQQTAPPPNASTSSSQQTATPLADQNTSTPTGQPQTEEQRRAQAQKELKQEESQRMLGVVPNFNTVMSGQAEAITSKQKFELFFRSSVDPFEFVIAGLDAGVEQAENSYPEYHQGFKGYALPSRRKERLAHWPLSSTLTSCSTTGTSMR